MKKLGILLGALLLCGASCYALPMTTVSATVVDSDATTWTNGSWRVQFTPNPSQPSVSSYNIGGVALDPTVLNQNGVLDGSGAFSMSVYQTAAITPVGSSWTLTVCPNASAPCGVYKFQAAGSTQDLSSALTTIIPAPRFHPVSGQYGYSDAEAILNLAPGSIYWNVTSSAQRCYSGSAWNPCSGAGPSSISGTLTPSYYPVASAAHTLIDSTITSSDFFYNSVEDGLALWGKEDSATSLNFIANADVFLTAGISVSSKAGTDVEAEAPSGLRIIGAADLSIPGTLGISKGTTPPSPTVNYIQLSAPSSVTAYTTLLPGVAPSDSVDYLGCTNAAPSICSWSIPTDTGITELTGDGTAGPGSGSQALTLAAVGSAGSCGDATHSCTLTFDTKGRETALSSTAISLPTGTDYYFTFSGCDMNVTGNSFNCHATYNFADMSPVVPTQPDGNYFMSCNLVTGEDWGTSSNVNSQTTTTFTLNQNVDRYNSITADITPVVWCHLHHN